MIPWTMRRANQQLTEIYLNWINTVCVFFLLSVLFVLLMLLLFAHLSVNLRPTKLYHIPFAFAVYFVFFFALFYFHSAPPTFIRLLFLLQIYALALLLLPNQFSFALICHILFRRVSEWFVNFLLFSSLQCRQRERERLE